MSTLDQDEQIFEIHRRMFAVLENICWSESSIASRLFHYHMYYIKTDVTNNNIKYNFLVIVHYCLAL